MAKRILAPLNDSRRSEEIVSLVAALAAGSGSTVRLLRVFPNPELVVDDRGRTVAYHDHETARLTAKGLSDLRPMEAQMNGVPVESVVRFGDPAEEILAEAEEFDADLIALTTSRRHQLHRAFAPGIADRVARATSVPTLVLHE